MKLTQQKGFTLIEMLIVLAIISILAAVAIPAYTTIYLKRAMASEAIVLLNGSKVFLLEYYGNWGRFPDDPASIGIKTTGKYVTGISISNANKTLIATTTNLGSLGLYYSLTSKNWTCFNSEIHGMTNGMPSKYLPITCRN